MFQNKASYDVGKFVIQPVYNEDDLFSQVADSNFFKFAVKIYSYDKQRKAS